MTNNNPYEYLDSLQDEPKKTRAKLRKRSWVYYFLPLPLKSGDGYRPGRVGVEFEASCRSCGSGNIMVRDAPHPAASLATIHTRKKAL